ncbi:MAG: asparagine synthase (glutamine-hydrolyzing) [Nitrospiraceae bacterium]|nr:MAG: asparagine synthase (glutamine-hydrolyzing) [Nitrospiraceae bacterium]
MCGIVGTIGLPEGVSRELLPKMLHRISYRGPDDEGFWYGDFCAFGHRRLSILDLSKDGHQPMVNKITGDIITYNGEIYNYIELRSELQSKGIQFTSRTDTEVILWAYRTWGEECLGRFAGMFAFALYDAQRKSVWLVRDRFGIKPLYYSRVGNGVFFSSEIKSIVFESGLAYEANPVALKSFAGRRMLDFSCETFFRGVYQIEPGNHIRVDCMETGRDLLTQQRYYRIEDKIKPEYHSHRLSVDTIAELLKESVRLHLRSDVPVGTTLSGGLDSSAITVLAHKKSDKRLHHIFSSIPVISTPETDLIPEVMKLVDARHHTDSPHGENFFQDLMQLVYHQDEPFADGSMYAHFRLMRLCRENNIPVILTGQGGDELFCGYYHHLYVFLGSLLKAGNFASWFKMSGKMRDWYNNSFSELALFSLRHALPPSFKNYLINIRRDDGVRILSKDIRSAEIPEDTAYSGIGFYYHGYLNALMRWTLSGFLHYEDRNSMAFGIESRVPFLDHRLVEAVISVPPEIHFQMGCTKSLLREAMQGTLPESVRMQRVKYGFPSMLSDWLLQHSDLVKQWLEEWIDNVPVLNKKEVFKMFHNFLASGGKKSLNPLWRAIVILLWYRIFITKQISTTPVSLSYQAKEPDYS